MSASLPDRRSASAQPRRGMSLVEIITVVAIIAVLLAILLPGLAVARRNAIWAKSQSNLRQIHTFMTSYGQDNKDAILPAAFDYSGQASDPRIKVRTESPPGVAPPIGPLRVGSWSDILWTQNKLGPIVDLSGDSTYDYRYDSPDRVYYEKHEDDDTSVFRSAARMTKTAGGDEALPFGSGARSTEVGQLGYFAANEFFDVRPPDATHPNRGKWWTSGQIVRPSQSMYILDSNAGEVTETSGTAANDYQLEGVDFRYSGDNVLMLFLDGHVTSESGWESLRDLEEARQIRVRDLDRTKPFYLP